MLFPYRLNSLTPAQRYCILVKLKDGIGGFEVKKHLIDISMQDKRYFKIIEFDSTINKHNITLGDWLYGNEKYIGHYMSRCTNNKDEWLIYIPLKTPKVAKDFLISSLNMLVYQNIIHDYYIYDNQKIKNS